MQRQRRALAGQQRPFRGGFLGIQQSAERAASAAPEVLHGLDPFKSLRDPGIADELVDFQQREHLVVRPFPVELDLRVLVRRAERLNGRGADVFPVVRSDLAQAFGIELAIPVGQVTQLLAVGHHDVHGFAALLVKIVNHRDPGGRIGRRVRFTHAFVHGSRPGQQLVDVDAAHRGRQQPDRRQHTEPAPDALRHDQGPVPLPGHDLPHGPLGRIGGDDDPISGRLFAQGLDESVPDDQKLRRGLCRLARLADDVDHRAGPVPADVAADGLEMDGVDVVEHEQPGAAPLIVGQQVVGRAVQCGLQRDVAQCRAADAEHEQMVGGLAVVGHDLLDLGELRSLVGQLAEAVLAGLALLGDFLQNRLDPRPQLAQIRLRQPVLAEILVLDIRRVQFQKRVFAHCPIPSRPFRPTRGWRIRGPTFFRRTT